MLIFLSCLRTIGSALYWGCRGRGFESRRPDHFFHEKSSGIPVSGSVYISVASTGAACQHGSLSGASWRHARAFRWFTFILVSLISIDFAPFQITWQVFQ